MLSIFSLFMCHRFLTISSELLSILNSEHMGFRNVAS